MTPKDEAGDEMTVTFKKGEKYELGDTNIVQDSGVSAESGSIEKAFEENTGNGFPYDSFQIQLDEEANENTVLQLNGQENQIIPRHLCMCITQNQKNGRR